MPLQPTDPLPVTRLLDLSGKAAVVTGAGRGIGAAIARRLAEAGAGVAVHFHIDPDPAAGVVKALHEKRVAAVAVGGDLSTRKGAELAMQAAVDTFGRLDILVNNVGSYPLHNLEDLPIEEWRSVYASNVEATFLCTQAAVRHLREVGGGSIVNLASIAAAVPGPAQSHYSSAKAAVVSFTRAAAQELATHSIRVNAISPGLISRPGIEVHWPEGVDRWRNKAPLVRLGEPEDVADACLFLVSPASRWVTGHNLVVDGGLLSAPAY